MRQAGAETWAIVLAATEEVIGGVTLKPRRLDAGLEIELGSHPSPSTMVGRGDAKEAAQALLAQARDLFQAPAFIRPGKKRLRPPAVRLGVNVEPRSGGPAFRTVSGP